MRMIGVYVFGLLAAATIALVSASYVNRALQTDAQTFQALIHSPN